MMHICPVCFETRPYPHCVRCTGARPASHITDSTLRYFLDVLAARPHSTKDARLIALAYEGVLTPEHIARVTVAGSPIGVVGERVTFTAVVEDIAHVESHEKYGDRYVVSFMTEVGQNVRWRTGESGKFDPGIGDRVRVTARITNVEPIDRVWVTWVSRPKGEILDRFIKPAGAGDGGYADPAESSG